MFFNKTFTIFQYDVLMSSKASVKLRRKILINLSNTLRLITCWNYTYDIILNILNLRKTV